ncbi:MAG TPA: hypothetical protein DG754_13040 [Bacteroidales bacterium]|jgi:hypothetical protein|nr:hypothetical protein [Bacteroidales bacterium]
MIYGANTSVVFCQGDFIQGDYSTRFLKFVGYKSNQAVFLNYSKKHLKAEENGKVFCVENKLGKSVFNLLEYKTIDEGKLVFVYNDYVIFRIFDNTYKFLVVTDNDTSILDLGLTGGFSSEFAFSKEKEVVYFAGFSEDHRVKTIAFTEKPIEIQNLPFLGFRLNVLEDYLYFDYNHIDKSKSTPVPVDLYRVKIGDWNNPELLVEFISDGWLPLNDSIVLLTLPIKGRGQQVFYNVNQKTYAPVQGKLPTKEIQYEGKQYLLDNV